MKQVPVEISRDALGWLLLDKDGRPVGKPDYYKTEQRAKSALKEAARKLPTKDAPKKRYAIDWSISGTFEVEARSAAEAEQIFDKKWNGPNGVDVRDGEVYVSNIEPVVD